MMDFGSEPSTHVDRKVLLSNVMKRTSEWILSQDIPSDITIHVGRTSFALHKFPLVSKCGYIRKLVSKSNDAKLSTIEIPDIPGGPEAFELAAKFCYEINFEISPENIALIRCVAEYLEMTDEYAVGNLVGLTETYLTEVGLKSIASSVSILHSSEKLLPIAEDIKLVNRSIDTIAYVVCKDSQYGLNSSTFDWWADDLTVLRIEFFQRVLIAMMARGFKQYALGPILMLYGQKSLGGLDISGKGSKQIEARIEHEKRVVLETIVSLLPREKNALSVSFLSLLLRAAIYLETTVSCRVDLERRMSLQLGQAVLDDVLFPSYSLTGDTFFDVETVKHIMMNFLEYEMVGNRLGFNDEENMFPSASDMEKVGKLMQDYLAEIASDSNLSVSEFTSVAEVIPEQLRITEDMMYKAIDMYLKAHPALSDVERKKVCNVMNCQKLTREACAHAAQNDRLPVQIVVQVLYYEQQRLRQVMDVSLVGADPPPRPSKFNWFSSGISPVTDEISSLKRENQDLKFELMKLKMKCREIEKCDDKSAASTPLGITTPPSDKPRLPRKSFITAVSRKLGKLYLSFGADEVTIPSPSKRKNKPSRDTNMVIILAALLCALLCALGLNSIVRCALRCSRRFAFESETARLAATGLKKSTLRQLPLSVYGSGVNIPATDCPICLGEFVDGEKVRVLPKCHHGFHVKCIDIWLALHSSCPTCRQSLLEQNTTAAAAAAAGDVETGLSQPTPPPATRAVAAEEMSMVRWRSCYYGQLVM